MTTRSIARELRFSAAWFLFKSMPEVNFFGGRGLPQALTLSSAVSSKDFLVQEGEFDGNDLEMLVVPMS